MILSRYFELLVLIFASDSEGGEDQTTLGGLEDVSKSMRGLQSVIRKEIRQFYAHLMK